MKWTSRERRSSFANDGALFPAGLGECGIELRAPLDRVAALPRLDLDELGDDLKAVGLGESVESQALGFDPEAGLALLGS
jgi:hypothetical protein